MVKCLGELACDQEIPASMPATNKLFSTVLNLSYSALRALNKHSIGQNICYWVTGHFKGSFNCGLKVGSGGAQVVEQWHSVWAARVRIPGQTLAFLVQNCCQSTECWAFSNNL